MTFDTTGDVPVEFPGCGAVLRDEPAVPVLLLCATGFLLVHSGLPNHGHLAKNF